MFTTIAVGLGLCLFPAGLFLLLWHGLAYMRDDSLINSINNGDNAVDEGLSMVTWGDVLSNNDFLNPSGTTESGGCPCGKSHQGYEQYCSNCLGKID